MSRRSLLRILKAAGATTVALIAVAAYLHASMKAPADLDYSRTRIGSSGLYRATFVPSADPVPVGRMHRWTLAVESIDGVPVDSATMTVNGGMPQHGHGLPTKPRMTGALGGGAYTIDGMKFNMGGWWTVSFAIQAAAGADTVTFNLDL